MIPQTIYLGGSEVEQAKPVDPRDVPGTKEWKQRWDNVHRQGDRARPFGTESTRRPRGASRRLGVETHRQIGTPAWEALADG